MQQQGADVFAPSGVHPPLPQKPAGSYAWTTAYSLSTHSSADLSPGVSRLHPSRRC